MFEIIREQIQNKAYWDYDLSFIENPGFGGWRLEEDTCKFIGKYCEIYKPEVVVEFGTGLSTLILAQEVLKGNVKTIWSIDHQKIFPGHPKAIVEQNKAMSSHVHFDWFPIKMKVYEGKVFQFYDIPDGFFKRMGHIDLVIIDGPPYYFDSREAALYAVYEQLSKKSLVLLDDANRKNREQKYIKQWKHHYGKNIQCEIFVDEFCKGLACLCLTGSKEKIKPFLYGERLSRLLFGIKMVPLKFLSEWRRKVLNFKL